METPILDQMRQILRTSSYDGFSVEELALQTGLSVSRSLYSAEEAASTTPLLEGRADRGWYHAAALWHQLENVEPLTFHFFTQPRAAAGLPLKPAGTSLVTRHPIEA